MTKDALHYAEPAERRLAPLATLARRMLYFACMVGIFTAVMVIVRPHG